MYTLPHCVFRKSYLWLLHGKTVKSSHCKLWYQVFLWNAAWIDRTCKSKHFCNPIFKRDHFQPCTNMYFIPLFQWFSNKYLIYLIVYLLILQCFIVLWPGYHWSGNGGWCVSEKWRWYKSRTPSSLYISSSLHRWWAVVWGSVWIYDESYF
jgi:hypothetical protein